MMLSTQDAKMLKVELLYPPNGKGIAITGIFKFSVLHKKLLRNPQGF